MRWPSSSSRIVLLATALWAVAGGTGMTCEDQDYLQSQRISLVEAELSTSRAIEVSHPYRGINSLDFSLHNTGSDDAQFALAVDLCMGCSYDEDCPTTADCRRIGTCQDGVTSCSSDTACGSDPEALETDDQCTLPPTGVCFLDGYSTPCVEVRYLTELVTAGDLVQDRLNESDLGVGDLLHVELACFAQCVDDTHCGSGASCDLETGACSDGDLFSCSAELDFVVNLRQPQCRDDADCDSVEICDFRRGICKGEDTGGSGCSTLSGWPTSPFVVLIGLGVLWAGHRRFGA